MQREFISTMIRFIFIAFSSTLFGVVLGSPFQAGLVAAVGASGAFAATGSSAMQLQAGVPRAGSSSGVGASHGEEDEQDNFYFDPAPVDQDVIEGREARLRCDVSNRRSIVFYWTLNGRAVPNVSRRYQDDSDLRIVRADRVQDGGSFRCVATNVTTGIALRSIEAKLNVLWIDRAAEVQVKSQKDGEETTIETTELTLKCNIDGNPEPSIEWLRNKIRLYPSDRIRMSKNRLKLIGVMAADNGVYECRAENLAGTVNSTNSFLLNAVGPAGTARLDAETFSPVVLVRRRSMATFNCRYSPVSGAGITQSVSTEWYFDQKRIATNNVSVSAATSGYSTSPGATAAATPSRSAGIGGINNRKYSMLTNGTLIIEQVDESDVGVYHCVGTGSAGPVQTFAAELQLAYIDELVDDIFDPRPPHSPMPMVLPTGGKLEIQCRATNGLPKPTIRWQGPGGSDIADTTNAGEVSRGTHAVVQDGGVLTISAADESDAGNYTCVVENVAGRRTRSLLIAVTVPPTISRPPLSSRVTEGDVARFDCRVSSTPYPVTVISWTTDDGPVNSHSPRFHVDESAGTLTIRDVTLQDEGNYACVVNTTAQPVAMSTNAHLYVENKRVLAIYQTRRPLDAHERSTYGDNVNTNIIAGFRNLSDRNLKEYYLERLKFKPVPINARLELGSVSRVPCRAEGRVSPTVRWYAGDVVGGLSTRLPEGVRDSEGAGDLTFDQVDRIHAGTYTCVASSEQGTINSSIRVDVVVKPKFKVRPVNTTVVEGHSTMIHCLAIGEPTPSTQWDRNNKINDFDFNRFKVLNNGSLAITETYMEDSGKYGCTVGNSGGLERTEVHLHVTSADSRHRLYGQGGTAAGNGDDALLLPLAVDGSDMVKTILIAVCSAVAYLAVVIGLTVYCSIRLIRAKNLRKHYNRDRPSNGNGHHPESALHAADHSADNSENTELMSKKIHKEVIGAVSSTSPAPTTNYGGTVSATSDFEIRSTSSYGAGGVYAAVGGGGGTLRSLPRPVPHSTPAPSQASTGSYERTALQRNQLQLISILGKGAYGDVMVAKTRMPMTSGGSGSGVANVEILVMVKSLLSRCDTHVAECRREIDLFSRVNHDHVVRLVGLCYQTDPVYLVTEYCEWGDLKTFLRATGGIDPRPSAISGGNGPTSVAASMTSAGRLPPLSVAQRITMCGQVALGMEHIAERGLTHRDLAARNILLMPSLHLKIALPGLCRDVYADEYVDIGNGRIVPLRWTAPEVLALECGGQGVRAPSGSAASGSISGVSSCSGGSDSLIRGVDSPWSTYSDVWSFGVLAWEVFSGAVQVPYAARTDGEVLQAALRSHASGGLVTSPSSSVGSGCRLVRPTGCPTDVWSLIEACSAESPRHRPTFSDVVNLVYEMTVSGH